jgi:hypothetical protein
MNYVQYLETVHRYANFGHKKVTLWNSKAKTSVDTTGVRSYVVEFISILHNSNMTVRQSNSEDINDCKARNISATRCYVERRSAVACTFTWFIPVYFLLGYLKSKVCATQWSASRTQHGGNLGDPTRNTTACTGKPWSIAWTVLEKRQKVP